MHQLQQYMAYIQELTHVQFPKDYYSTGRGMYCLRGRLRIRHYSSCIRDQVFHRLKRTKVSITYTNISYYWSLSRNRNIHYSEGTITHKKGLTHKIRIGTSASRLCSMGWGQREPISRSRGTTSQCLVSVPHPPGHTSGPWGWVGNENAGMQTGTNSTGASQRHKELDTLEEDPNQHCGKAYHRFCKQLLNS